MRENKHHSKTEKIKKQIKALSIETITKEKWTEKKFKKKSKINYFKLADLFCSSPSQRFASFSLMCAKVTIRIEPKKIEGEKKGTKVMEKRVTRTKLKSHWFIGRRRREKKLFETNFFFGLSPPPLPPQNPAVIFDD